MRKVLFAAAAALSLGACSNLQTLYGEVTSTSISPQAALAAANAFDAVETTATAYLSLPACGGATIACRNAAATANIVPAVRSGRAARKAIEGLLQSSNGGPIPVANYNTLEAAIQTLQSTYAQFNIASVTK